MTKWQLMEWLNGLNKSLIKAALVAFQVIFFKLTILLFPSSDYRHPVVTPALQFMSEILSNAKPFSRSSIAAGIAIATIMVEVKLFNPEILFWTLS